MKSATMTFSNVKYHDVPFDEYLSLPGKSYSGIKNEDVEWGAPTPKMVLGTNVHNYLLDPASYTHENVRIVKPLALALKQAIGPLLKYLQPEQAVTADFKHEGLTMAYKGRIDLLVPKRIVIDIKVTDQDIAKVTNFFGYNNQLSGYSIPTEVKTAVIISINPKTLITKITNIPISKDWWEQQIIRYGTPY